MNSKTIVVLYGGQSSEHEVSCVSAVTVLKAIDTAEYDIVRIGITKEGHWIYTPDNAAIESGEWYKGTTTAILSPDASKKEVLLVDADGNLTRKPVDVVFPVLHGLYGEDGSVQGLFELAKLPYVGCGVLASCVGMDKVYTKIVVDDLGIAQADYVAVRKEEMNEGVDVVAKIEAKLPYPVFVKPSNAGSSQGVSKAHNREELQAALALALKHDRKILVEKAILGRELECAVLGTNQADASGIGEILSAAEFYDYEAKYHNAQSRTVIGPELPEGKAEEIRQAAMKIFSALDGYGLARVDFFLEKDTNRVIFNEINTLPGFTGISMYPMLWKERGLSIEELVKRLIELAFKRYA